MTFFDETDLILPQQVQIHEICFVCRNNQLNVTFLCKIKKVLYESLRELRMQTTTYGMQKSLSNLYALFNVIPSIERIQDVVVFVERFSKDCMSDLLTNILRKELCEFTSEQMEAHQKSPDGIQIQKAWDANAGEWRNEELPYWLIENKKILLVPKMWVRKHYLFSTDQYLSRVIVERIRRENGQEDVPKKEIKRRFDKSDPHWKYKTAIQYTKKNPDALVTYHERMNGYYDRKNGAISDDDLDMATYGYCIKNKRM